MRGVVQRCARSSPSSAEPVTTAAHWFGSQLARPRGWGGRLVGHLMRRINREPIALAIEALDIAPGDVVLDLGCGPGLGIALLARTAKHVHGVDASPTMLRMAEQANRKRLLNGTVSVREGSFTAIPLADQSVDKILAVNVAYFWHDIASVIAELRRISRPGAKLAIYVTARETMKHWRFADLRTHRHFDVSGLEVALGIAGIMREQIEATKHRLSGKVHAIVALVSL